jgi:integrase
MVDAPRIPRPQVHALDTDGARKLLQAAQGHRFEAIIALAVTLGLRRGEVLGLRWVDVSFEERTLHVHQAVQRIGRKVQVTEVKTDRSRRTLALPDNVIRALRLRRAHQAQQRLLSGAQWQDQDLVFTGPNGAPLEPVTLNRAYKALLKAAELPIETRFHDLRHSAASLLLAQGVHARVIMDLLGHSSISVTMNTYGHIMPAAMREAASTMEAILAVEK